MGIKKGDIVEVEIQSLAYGGKGIAYLDDLILFVEAAIPGQKVKALIRKKKQSYAEAVIKELILPSPEEIKPACPHFGECGGCRFQNLPYEKQLEHKTAQIDEIYSHLGQLSHVQVQEIIASEKIYRYRNKVEFTFSSRRWMFRENDPPKPKNFALGFHKPRIYDKVLDIDECHLQPEIGDKILNSVKKYCLKEKLTPYDTRTSSGFLRHLVIRHSLHTRQTMVNLVTGYKDLPALKPLSGILSDIDKNVTSFVNNINSRKATIAFGEKEYLLSGKPYIEDKIGNLIFRISANSFFQTNTLQAEKLYRIIKEISGVAGKETVWDLYCGAGSISLFLAKEAEYVHGLEIIDSAISDAKENAHRNGIENVSFHTVDLNKITSETYRPVWASLPEPDVIILDPPRSGAHPKLMKFLARLNNAVIVYVSCNPATQIRDIQHLLSENWKIDLIQPVDMFPQTPHIECVTRLVK